TARGIGGPTAATVPGLASTCAFTNSLYHSCYATEAVSGGHEHRSAGPGRVPGGHPPALYGRADPRRAAQVGRAARALADDEGVRGRPGGACAPPDRDRALRHLACGEAGGGADAPAAPAP